jgi:hypothetical protein
LQAGSEGRRTREKKRKRKKRGGEESGDVWDRREAMEARGVQCTEISGTFGVVSDSCIMETFKSMA